MHNISVAACALRLAHCFATARAVSVPIGLGCGWKCKGGDERRLRLAHCCAAARAVSIAVGSGCGWNYEGGDEKDSGAEGE
jgi:hypothetical protein